MDVIVVLVVASLLATFAVLVAGGISMVRGGHYDETHAFPLMEARVVLQLITVELVLAALFLW